VKVSEKKRKKKTKKSHIAWEIVVDPERLELFPLVLVIFAQGFDLLFVLFWGLCLWIGGRV